MSDMSTLAAYVPTSRTVNSKSLTGNITLNASDVGAAPAMGADDNYITNAEKAALHSHPAVIAQGATQADARTAIGAGTSNLTIGTTAGTAKEGNYVPPDASETVKGIAEFATSTETVVGTATNLATTPAGVKAVADTKAPLVGPVLTAATPAPIFSAQLAPALDLWTLAGGASYVAPSVVIPAGGSMAFPLAVVSGKTYQVDVSRTGSTGGEMTVSLGAAVIAPPAWGNASVTLIAPSTGTLTLTVGGVTTWAATVTGVVVREVTAFASPVISGASGGSELRRYSSNNAMGYDAQRSLTTGNYNNAMGYDAQRSLTTGNYNNAMGHAAQYSLTTGNYNNAMGYAAQYSLTTGNYNNAMGHYAQRSLTTGNYNNAMGYDAQRSLTTGNSNNAMGHAAQYSPAGVAANATTTASYQTSVGHETGQSSVVQADHLTTLGYRAIGTTRATALGSSATAGHVGSVALGYGTATTAESQVAVGARDVEVQDATKGIILKSPDGSRWRATITDTGVSTWTKL
ncbi:MAG: hypothetical protein EOL86_12865 [Deltaproteobacteria bacterium]|nr:hypothetical protein [Deltaproteobacteria bacterium]